MSATKATTKAAVAIGAALAAVAIAFLVSVVLALPVKWLWNWVAVDLLGQRQISVLEAWGLSMLVKLLWPGSGKIETDRAK